MVLDAKGAMGHLEGVSLRSVHRPYVCFSRVMIPYLTSTSTEPPVICVESAPVTDSVMLLPFCTVPPAGVIDTDVSFRSSPEAPHEQYPSELERGRTSTTAHPGQQPQQSEQTEQKRKRPSFSKQREISPC